MLKKQNDPEAVEFLARHSRKCAICHHPDREDIEDAFLRWRATWYIQRTFELDDARCIYSHARAFGLIERRRENLLPAIDNIVEQSRDVVPSADAVLRAIRAYSCLDNYGRWTDPPSRVVFTASKDSPTGPLGPAISTPAFETNTIPAPETDQSEAPVLSPGPSDTPEPPPSPGPEPSNASAASPAPGPEPSDASAASPATDIPTSPNASEDQILIPLPGLETRVSD